MANPRNKFHSKNSFFLSLAFEQAKKNLGSTKENPSVGCIVEKNDRFYPLDTLLLTEGLMLNLTL